MSAYYSHKQVVDSLLVLELTQWHTIWSQVINQKMIERVVILHCAIFILTCLDSIVDQYKITIRNVIFTVFPF